MKKNAFTIVELLAVIVILAVILLIAVPKINNIVQTNKQSLYNTTIKEIEKTAAQYVASHPELMGEESFDITITTLCTDKYLDCPVINPLTNVAMDGYVSVSYDVDNESY